VADGEALDEGEPAADAGMEVEGRTQAVDAAADDDGVEARVSGG